MKAYFPWSTVGIVLIRAFIQAQKGGRKVVIRMPNWKSKKSVMKQLFRRRKIGNWGGLFTSRYMDSRVFYVQQFDEYPCILIIGQLDITKAYAWIKDNYADEITATYQHSHFDHDGRFARFNITLLALEGERMLEFGSDYCEILHTRRQYGWANQLAKDLSLFKMEGMVIMTPAEILPVQVTGFFRKQEMN